MRALDRKLIRDLWAVRSQAIAIALVFASGIALFTMSVGTFSSLRLTQEIYYRDFAFAEVFGSVKRAPRRLEQRIREIPGVAEAETRVVVELTLDVPGLDEPASGRVVSLPDSGRPLLDRLYLRAGRWIEPDRPQEVLVAESFAEANDLGPGDSFGALINGRYEELEIVGIALSPEFVYIIRPGELFPDQRRYAVIWMAREPLATAFDMEGGFNDVTLTLSDPDRREAVIAELDRLLEPYGAVGAIPRDLQVSHWYLENELRGLQSMAFFIPLIFLSVAAFLINVVLRRTVAVQREQIAALKALGYGNPQLAAHYMKWALAIAVSGAVLGVGAGVWMSNGMLALYQDYFQFPLLAYDWSPMILGLAVLLGLSAAGVGAFGAVRAAVTLPPAEAMRPQPPARYGVSWVERILLGARRWLAAPTRIIVRNITRQPARTIASIVGIAFAGAIMVIGSAMLDSVDELLSVQFDIAQRQDVMVAFNEPASADALHELARLPGVLKVEPMRSVPVRMHHGSRSRQVGISGLPESPELLRIVGADHRPRTAPRGGLLLTTKLAEILGVEVGERVLLEVLEGRRPTRWATVTATVDEFTGTAAYMEIDALRDLVGEGRTLSAATLLIDDAAEHNLMRTLKAVPAVAGVALKRAVIDNFQTYLADNMGRMLGINIGFAVIIAFGVIYNTARISLSERNRELASLRVMGFRRGEIAYILLGELTLLTVISLPIGAVLGYGLLAAAMQAFDTELYRMPLVLGSRTFAIATLVVAASATVSGLIVRRRLRQLDLIGVLKTRE